VSKLTHCPGCEYPWVGDSIEICPECGYHLQQEDREFHERRTHFLALTRISVIGWLCALAILCLLAYGFPLVGMGLGIAGGFVLIANRPRLHKRLILRLWMLNLVWIVLPWIAAGLSIRGLRWLEEIYYYGWPTGAQRLRGILVLLGFFIVVSCFSLAMWRWRWRSLAPLAGIPDAVLADARSRIIRRFVFIPVLVVVALGCLVVVVPALMLLLDWLAPGWDRG
jgi:hypothetical protein